jgi:hypothetical protein
VTGSGAGYMSTVAILLYLLLSPFTHCLLDLTSNLYEWDMLTVVIQEDLFDECGMCYDDPKRVPR